MAESETLEPNDNDAMQLDHCGFNRSNELLEEPTSAGRITIGINKHYVDDDDDDDDEFALQGAETLDLETDEYGFSQLDPRKRCRPNHHSLANAAARRSAVRTQATHSESFLIDEADRSSFRTRKNITIGTGPSTLCDRSATAATPGILNKKQVERDKDDNLIITMRELGYSDEQITSHLAQEGRALIESKSVATRISRIKLSQAKTVDKLLEDGWKEWEYDDDVLLMQAYDLADIEVNYEIERARAWRFKKVAEAMRRLKRNAIFSEKACRERYQALVDGTARIPSLIDDNPQARLEEMEAFRMERQAQRKAEDREQEEKAEVERRIKEEAAIRQAEKSEAIAIRRQAKQQEKSERAMKRAAQNQIKLQKAKENKEAKATRLERIRIQKVEAMRRESQRMLDMNSNRRIAVKHVAVKALETVTEDTPDPRGWLSTDDLKKLCGERKLSDFGKTVDEFVYRLRDADDVWSLAQIKTMCRSKGMPTTGSKLSLKYSLALADARRFPSFEENLELAEAEERAENGEDVMGIEDESEISSEDDSEDDSEDANTAQ